MLIRQEPADISNPVVDALNELNRRQSEALIQLSMQLRTMADTVERLEREVRKLEKVTPMQVTELNARLRRHGRDLCEQYGLDGCETKLNALIRAAVKAEFGVSSMKDLCRSDYSIALNVIEMWEDSDKLFNMRR